jgi:hypothetical protein
MAANPTPEVGDQWRQIDDGRTILIQKISSQYASGIWLADEVTVVDPKDESKKRTVKIPECAAGVLTGSFADASRFKLLHRR